mmetsp:Transcript_5436/g.10368  ORF Transcript_5436/g.10368 Transcript_5436/m.10368 type:complete len:723 (+) Transcript_5436:47-2215(+)|eukprot:CAMPEP_0175156580 /NCGR_PEP_ID=MMETSP0087-20121206/21684_1 /TAXON_ID=136419 /ORGANISM="Unknown Unknown, Strain D1" /LENGTH=722 /DNA_ID=CAMNT_0016444011 /DNA_START=42 /DNA_END=2210 /DNA_ORIENTATION=+
MSDDEEGEQNYQVVFDDEPEKVWKYLPPKDGKAKAKFANGDTYHGEYKDGKRHGKGLYTLASGATYDGEYVENKKEGWGVFTAPDGGKYTGEWMADKRHGKGTYAYINQDSYTGDWANGTKHGWGTYVYAHISSSLSGTWSNGQLVDGTWEVHDGSKYCGSFLSNQPAGEGLIQFPSGITASGKYADLKFIAEFFKRAHPNARPPERHPPDVFKKACRSIDKCVAKADHCNSMDLTAKQAVKGVPNLRRIGTSPVFVCGQPTTEGFKAAVEDITGKGLEKVLWCNTRAEPVLYVNGKPYAPRDRRELVKSLRLGEITPAQIAELESRFAENVKFMTKKKGGLHNFYEDFTNPEDPDDKRTELKTTEVTEPDAVKAISTVYAGFGEEDLPLAYERLPLDELAAPGAVDFDRFTELVKTKLEGGALVLNDTLGAGVSVPASVIAFLLTDKGGEAEEGGEEGGGEGGGDEGDEGDKKEKVVVEEHKYNPEAPDINFGEFNIIMKLVDSLNGPDPEEERLRLEEEARVAKEAAEAKAAEEAAAAAEKAAAEGGEENKEEEGGEEKKDGEEGGEGYGEEKKEEGGEEAEKADETPKEETDESEAKEEPKEPEKPKNAPDYGFTLKKKVDDAISKCGEVVNLLTQLLDLRKEFEASDDLDGKQAAKNKAQRLLQTYFNFILFACYIDKNQPSEFDKTYSQWSEDPEIQELAGLLGTSENGALSEFEWV